MKMKTMCSPFAVLLVFMCSGLLCFSENIVVDQNNCQSNTTLLVNKTNPTVQLRTIFSSSILSKNCLIYISNSDFQANRIYEVLIRVSGNITRGDHYYIRIYMGHPDNNKAIMTLDNTVQKWSGQLPSWDMYVGMVSHTVTELDVIITIQECKENCYTMNTPSIIPTHILNVPGECDSVHCLDKYAVSYHIRTNFYRQQTCSLNFTVMNNPSVCLTIGDHWRDSIIKSTKCRTMQFRRGTDVLLTLDRLIFKPWCLPWTFEDIKHLSIVWGDHINVSGQSLCTLTLYTNTSRHGSTCFGVTTTSTPKSAEKDNTTIMIIVTVISLVIMIILAILIIYCIVTRGRRPMESHIVASFHHSSVQVMSPPPYSIAVSDTIPTYQQVIQQDHMVTNNDEAQHTDTTSSSSGPDSHISPPPYSELTQSSSSGLESNTSHPPYSEL